MIKCTDCEVSRLRWKNGTSLTLSTVIVDIRVIWVVLDGLLKSLECLLRVTLFHVHTRDFDPRLSE